MTILIAPDKFKGSLSAREVADNIAIGLREVLPEANIDIVAMADGGEGTADVICDALHGSWVNCRAHDPLGREIVARYAFVEDRKLAVMEMSAAAGMKLLRPDEYDVDRASTFGVGEMLLDATRHGANEIIVGLGGSATNDGGFGMARALGFRFFDERNRELTACVSVLTKVARVTSPEEVVGAFVSNAQLERGAWHKRLYNSRCRKLSRPSTCEILCWVKGARREYSVRRKASRRTKSTCSNKRLRNTPMSWRAIFMSISATNLARARPADLDLV